MRIVAAALLVAAALTVAVPAAASTDAAGCSLQAVGSVSGGMDLSNGGEWHLRQADVVTARMLTPVSQTHVNPGVALFGLSVSLPLYNHLTGRVFLEGPDRVGDVSRFVRTAGLSFQTDSCSVSFLAVVDDQSPVLTVAGGAGAVLSSILLLLLVILAVRPAGPGRRVLGAVLGLLAGVALSVLLQQLLWLDPRSLVTLLPPAAGLLGGAALPGALRPPETGRVGP